MTNLCILNSQISLSNLFILKETLEYSVCDEDHSKYVLIKINTE